MQKLIPNKISTTKEKLIELSKKKNLLKIKFFLIKFLLKTKLCVRPLLKIKVTTYNNSVMDHSLSGTEEKPGVRLLSWGIN